MLQCGTTNEQTNKQLKIELLSRRKLEAEFRNYQNLALVAANHLSSIPAPPVTTEISRIKILKPGDAL